MFFDKMITSFIKYLLNFNRNEVQEGILGKIKAYYGVVEAQGRGALHFHVIVWTYGFIDPKTFKERLNDNTFIRELLEYILTLTL